MSAIVKLGAKMPGDFEVNGLDALAETLVAEPQTLRAAFVLFDVQKITVSPDSGAQVPTVRVRRFEPLGDADTVSQALRDEYNKAVEARTGVKALPLDLVEIVHEDGLDWEGDE